MRQGCPLSPILFNIFLDDIDEMWEKRKEGGTAINKEKIHCLKYADDIVVMADYQEELQAMLNSLQRYSKKNRMKINPEKTKIMVFRRKGREGRKANWKIEGQKIEEVKQVKYLGFTFTQANSHQTHINRITQKANKTVNVVWSILKRTRCTNWKKIDQLFTSLIQSIITYGAEIWGLREWAEVERVQAKYYKMVLGLRRNTPSYLWKGETGKLNIKNITMKKALKYMLEIGQLEDERLPKICLDQTLRDMKNDKVTRWGGYLRKTGNDAGEPDIIDTLRGEDMRRKVEKMEQILTKTMEQEIQEDWGRVDKSTYCDFYKTIKTEWGREGYLEGAGWATRTGWARLRCGSALGDLTYGDGRQCRGCGRTRETLEHAWTCTQTERHLDEETLTWKREAGGVKELFRMLKGRINKKLLKWTMKIRSKKREETGEEEEEK